MRIMNVKLAPLWFILPVTLLLLNACAPVPITPPAPVKPEATKSTKPTKPEPVVVQKKPELHVAILMSDTARFYSETAKAISIKLHKRVTEYVLSGKEKHDARLIRKIQSGQYSHVVALGQRAAMLASHLKSQLVVFGDVFQYQNDHLVSHTMKGVSYLPSPEQVFKDWKALSPKLGAVALLTSKNLDYYVDRAKKAAHKQGIELVHRVVKNDKEFVYVSKRLPPNVQGEWILPDSKILSGSALKTVLSFNAKNGRQTAVFSKGLLSFGCLFSVSVPREAIANLIVERLRDSLGKKTIPGPEVLIASDRDLVINKKMAVQLGLTIPPQYRKFVSD